MSQYARAWRLCGAWIAVVVVAGLVPGCEGGPLAVDASWLAGSWRWTGSWESPGRAITPDAPNALVLTLHEDGVALVTRYDTLFVQTRFEVDISLPIRIRFDASIPEVDDKSYVIREPDDPPGAHRFTLSNGATNCDDCLNVAGFTRVQ